nr:MAG TPA: hypothetical protein [Caudoviricetes sp.]
MFVILYTLFVNKSHVSQIFQKKKTQGYLKP